MEQLLSFTEPTSPSGLQQWRLEPSSHGTCNLAPEVCPILADCGPEDPVK